MRVTSSLWVGAFLRRCNQAGASAVVVRRGADEAGAIFIVVDRLDGQSDFYGPAPQSSFDEGQPTDRLFQKIAASEDAQRLTDRIAREVRFDPDLWVVAVEDRDGRAFIDVVPESAPR